MNALDVLLGAQPGIYRAELSPTMPVPVAPGWPCCARPRMSRTPFPPSSNARTQVGILTQGESSLARARENSDAAYRGGVVSLIEVLDADSNLLQVRDAKAQPQTEGVRTAIAEELSEIHAAPVPEAIDFDYMTTIMYSVKRRQP